ncbi:DUF5681 domain-containing protein [Methylorubrum thiocyanatum]|uniref:DUF5681 domain-containing protein n=1 Tax=Methylorubrum thiocyanatum TaxID=47958 RepID=UPI003F7FCE9B
MTHHNNPHLDPEACRKRGWKKGESGNPKGRPPVIREVQELAKAQTEFAINTLVSIAGNEKANGSARVQAAVALLDRAWGRPKQSVDVKVDHEATGLAAAIRAMTEAKQQAVADQRPVIEVESVVEVVATASGKD